MTMSERVKIVIINIVSGFVATSFFLLLILQYHSLKEFNSCLHFAQNKAASKDRDSSNVGNNGLSSKDGVPKVAPPPKKQSDHNADDTAWFNNVKHKPFTGEFDQGIHNENDTINGVNISSLFRYNKTAAELFHDLQQINNDASNRDDKAHSPEKDTNSKSSSPEKDTKSKTKDLSTLRGTDENEDSLGGICKNVAVYISLFMLVIELILCVLFLCLCVWCCIGCCQCRDKFCCFKLRQLRKKHDIYKHITITVIPEQRPKQSDHNKAGANSKKSLLKRSRRHKKYFHLASKHLKQVINL